MHQPQCHGPCRPASVVRDNSVMRSPYSDSSFSTNSSYMPGEPGSPQQGAVTSPERQNSSQLSPVSPQQPQVPFSSDTGSSRLKRRASQGSLLTKPSPVSRFLSRSNASLHLPSFEHLGLSKTKSPSRIESRTHSADSRLRLHTTSAASSSLATRASQSTSTVWDFETKGDYPTALPPTPPEDDEYVAWNPRSGMLLFESPLSREPGPMPMDEGPNVDSAARGATSDGLSSPSDQLSNVSPSSSGSPGSSGDMDCDLNSWLESGIETTVSSLPFPSNSGEAVKIVSQMLPYPCTADKNAAVHTNDDVFCSLIQAVQRRIQSGQSPSYINITHAVPEQFSLSNLPYSPPNTPRSLFAADDYFNSSVFSSAAVVSAYHDFRGIIQGKALRFPMPVVPPFSVHLSVLERYLPPSSPQEYKDLFNPGRPSFLVDRMSELSRDGGSLLFIYPTKRGGSTFKSQYLGPILDPLLRQLVVVNELSADVGRYLGKLSTVSHMEDFDTMRNKLAQLCSDLSSSSSQFTIADARKGSAHLDRHVWTEWFIHQERTRMKEVLSLYWQNGRRLPAAKAASNMSTNYLLEDKEVTSAMLLGEILDGIRKRPYGEETEPRDGIELGVFVIRRSH
ncbi:hypothetical protein BDV33DRAFT_23480 [Aspergillus novoparasiticus]|uniref:Uncharacterized protein n=1 Tax=Aspergillus novoparasiticus TaxID=986946 RepID=A0A5N6F1N3_9EURO|nr:hypothetical protein BDV33DRAFT_23480 [Aspergillus novoparasiticus]